MAPGTTDSRCPKYVIRNLLLFPVVVLFLSASFSSHELGGQIEFILLDPSEPRGVVVR